MDGDLVRRRIYHPPLFWMDVGSPRNRALGGALQGTLPKTVPFSTVLR